MEKKLRLAVVGCGAVAYRWYLKGLSSESEFFELSAVCDIREGAAKQAARDFHVSFWCTDTQQLAQKGVDVAVVLTRHNDHFKHVKFFLQNKTHVYTEKPIASSVKEARELMKLAEENSVKLGSAPQVMFSSRNRRAKQLVENGTVGKVTLVRASCSNLGPAGRKDTTYDPEWFYQEGGSLRSLGIYGLAALIWILGAPKMVSGCQGIAIPERTVLYGPYAGKKFRVTAPDNVTAILSYGNGMSVLFDGSYAVANPPAHEFEIHGTKGSLLIGGFGGKSSIMFKGMDGSCAEVGPDDDCHVRWNLSWGPADLAEAVMKGRKPLASADFAVSVLRVIEAIENSSHLAVSIAI